MIIDLSANNGIVNWALVKTNPERITGVICKVNEGNGSAYVDKQLSANAKGAVMNGYSLGYYHFATLNNAVNVMDDAKAEANFFLDSLHGLPLPNMPYILDIETNKANLTPAQVEIWINTFFDTLQARTINNVCIYSYADFLNRNLPAVHNLGTKYRLWLAGYTAQPILPKGWGKADMWQYSATGKVLGINGNVDCSKVL